MHVEFEGISFKNFLSYGNAETHIQLNKHRHTIITAKNGSGKSTIMDAICYALYGKPYRSIKLGQLINSINKKALLVKLEFSISTDKYLIIRGQKPNIFEIYKNGELILEEAARGDYQSFLETDVLGINFKTFKQIIAIGKAAYVSFMNLEAKDRRNITEEVLDIAIFSSMQEIAKKNLSAMKSLVDTLTYECQLLKTQLESQKEMLETLKEESESKALEVEKKRSDALERIADFEKQLTDIDNTLTEYDGISDKQELLNESLYKLSSKMSKVQNKLEELCNTKEFFSNDACPTCGQSIDETLKEQRTHACDTSIQSLTDDRTNIEGMITSVREKLTEVVKKVNDQTSLLNNRRTVAALLAKENSYLKELTVPVHTNSIDMCRAKIKEIVQTLVNKTEDKNQRTIDYNHYKVAVELLKDTGIKAKVIATFIPVMNELINEYLQMFDMFVSFELDETFNETIKSRNRDTFTYNSFSEGEKQRIDLSILFAWRRIAMSRNSISTNLIIFDETLDASLDNDAVDTFTTILDSIGEKMNTIVISHRDVVPEMFDRHIQINKVKDFSIVSES